MDPTHTIDCVKSDKSDINRYCTSLVNLLDKIEINDHDEFLKKDLLNTYELLSFLNLSSHPLLNPVARMKAGSCDIVTHTDQKWVTDNRIPISLIREELKSRKLFYVLGKVGIDDCFFQVHLDFVIMDLLGMNDGTDETYAIYDAIVEKHARRIVDSKESIERQARKVYDKLLEAKKSLPIQNPIP